MSVSSNLGTPIYPPPPPLARGMHSFDQDPQSMIDPNLINPPGTAPWDFRPVSAVEPPDLPAREEKPSKKKGLKKLSGLGDSFRGGFSKMRGKFQKQKAPKRGESIEFDVSDEEVQGSREVLSEGKDYSQEPKLDVPQKQSKVDSLAATLKNMLKKPQDADPTPYTAGDTVELKQVETSSWMTFGNFINAIIIAYIISGLIMCACIGVNSSLVYIGPAFLGIGIFALVGKMYYTMVWMETDPVPASLQPLFEKFGRILEPISGRDDPYGVKSGSAYGHQKTVYLGPMSASSASNLIQMEPFNYPRAAQPKMYDESIDTRVRTTAPEPVYPAINDPPMLYSGQQTKIPW